MVLDYTRLLVAIALTCAALMVALNRHHSMLGYLSRLSDIAADRKVRTKRPRRRMKTVDILDPEAGKGGWVTGRGKEIPAPTSGDDDLDWLVDEDEDPAPVSRAQAAPTAPTASPSPVHQHDEDDDDDDFDWLVVDDD